MDGDAGNVSDRQRRRPAMQADGVAEVLVKWSARRAAPSVRALSACCIRNCWGGAAPTDGMSPVGGCEAPVASNRRRAGSCSHASSVSVQVPIAIPSHMCDKAVKRLQVLPGIALSNSSYGENRRADVVFQVQGADRRAQRQRYDGQRVARFRTSFLCQKSFRSSSEMIQGCDRGSCCSPPCG